MRESSVTDRQKRLMAMGQMAASLAHEIRNPLGSMEIYCSLLRRELTDQPNNFKLVEQILKGIRNLERVVANSLQFARDVRITRREIRDKRAYLKEALGYVSPVAQERGVLIELISNNSKTDVADPSQLQQVIINLLLNAIDAVDLRNRLLQKPEEDGNCALVKLTEQTLENGDWQIRIIDRGIGIEPEHLDRIFDPFFSTKSNGTGLGMSVAYSIVKAHKGEIAIESEANCGTTVTILLPGNYERMALAESE